MYLDFYDTIELCERNRDIYEFTKKHGCLDFEVADMLEMTLDEYRLSLSEPLDDNEKRRIAKAVKAVIRYSIACQVESKWYDSAYFKEEQKKHDLAKYCKTSKVLLGNNRKYTGQNKNYYEGSSSWD